MSKPDGGSAFPRSPATVKEWESGHEREVTYEAIAGMSLRDYFAGQAHQPDVHAHIKMIHASNPTIDAKACGEQMAAEFATWAYQFADAMLAERAK